MTCPAETADVGCGCCVHTFTCDLEAGHLDDHTCMVDADQWVRSPNPRGMTWTQTTYRVTWHQVEVVETFHAYGPDTP